LRNLWDVSTRKYSVQRHINNKHHGYSRVIPYLEYFVGRQSGSYAPSAPPLYRSKKRTDPIDIFQDEYYRELARRTVDQKFSTKPFWAKSFLKRSYWTEHSSIRQNIYKVITINSLLVICMVLMSKLNLISIVRDYIFK
jgi:hypothetical protein